MFRIVTQTGFQRNARTSTSPSPRPIRFEKAYTQAQRQAKNGLRLPSTVSFLPRRQAMSLRTHRNSFSTNLPTTFFASAFIASSPLFSPSICSSNGQEVFDTGYQTL